MIYSLRGTLAAVEQNFVVVECGGVGYGLRATMHTIGNLPRQGNEVKLFTHMNVREGAVELFGFLEKGELECFRMLTAVSGVGPKAALNILSELTPEKLLLAVAAGDFKAITRAPGVGTKLANRIALELRDKIKNEELAAGLGEAGGAASAPGSNAGEAVSALVVLGYAQSQAAAAVAGLSPDAPVGELIKAALKRLSSPR